VRLPLLPLGSSSQRPQQQQQQQQQQSQQQPSQQPSQHPSQQPSQQQQQQPGTPASSHGGDAAPAGPAPPLVPGQVVVAVQRVLLAQKIRAALSDGDLAGKVNVARGGVGRGTDKGFRGSEVEWRHAAAAAAASTAVQQLTVCMRCAAAQLVQVDEAGAFALSQSASVPALRPAVQACSSCGMRLFHHAASPVSLSCTWQAGDTLNRMPCIPAVLSATQPS
jgi:hypothetical protein